MFWFAALDRTGAGPARLLLRLARIPFPRHRRLSLDHHAGHDPRAAAGLLPQRLGFGGNNGLTDFKDILGFNVQAEGTRAALSALSCLALIVAFLICRAVVTSKPVRVLIAIRDANPAPDPRLPRRIHKLFVFTLSACIAGVVGALYVPQVQHHQPGATCWAIRSRR